MSNLLRSNVEFAKRVFLDRLTTDQQPLANALNPDGGPGDEYVYANVGDSGNFGIGFDCSGLCGVVLAIAVKGPNFFSGTGYFRLFSTETFPGPLTGFRRVSQSDCVNGDYPIKVMICHGGGGPNSHMACWIDGWNMESNGDYGLCTAPGQITGLSSNYWNDWLVYDGPIAEDTTYRTPMTYPRGLDYAGGRISGASLKANGISFVCRYLTDGGAGLPGKQLQSWEFTDLTTHGVDVVFNWETTATRMLDGANAGTADASAALAYIRSLPGAPQNPVVYFSADFDATPAQQIPINAYLYASAYVLGGPQYVGIYGGYWPVSRALDAGVCKYAWQTEAWSGGNIDARVNIVQRNGLGYQTIDGVECDINEAHTDDFGQFISGGAVTPPAPAGPSLIPADKPTDPNQLISEIWDQLRISWPQLGNRTLVDAVAELLKGQA